MKVKTALTTMVILATAVVAYAGDSTFESVPLAPESYYNGSDLAGGFSDGGNWFVNNYSTQYSSWDGFACSNITDTASSGLDAQYNAITGGGEGGSSNYAVGYLGYTMPPTIQLGAESVLDGAYFSNSSYAYYSMRDGDAFAKKFGGATGNDPDWFLLTITGLTAGGGTTATAVEFYLADFRFADSGLDYILDEWVWVDLSSLGPVTGLQFAMSSSDTGTWGMNTPGYFVMDNLAVPEPTSLALLGLAGLVVRRRR